jgi:hypothetical protein
LSLLSQRSQNQAGHPRTIGGFVLSVSQRAMGKCRYFVYGTLLRLRCMCVTTHRELLIRMRTALPMTDASRLSHRCLRTTTRLWIDQVPGCCLEEAFMVAAHLSVACGTLLRSALKD